MLKNHAFVIEDDEDLSNIFTKALQSAGFTVEAIRNGMTAQQRLLEIHPDLIILDMHLPEVSGATLLKQIREDENVKDARVILTTADAQLGEYYNQTADLVLIKPITYSQLRDLASRYFKK